MHELSICQDLIDQVARIALQHSAHSVDKIVVRVGPLSGVEIPLLHNAFTLARAGTVAEKAALVTDLQPIRVACKKCGAESDAQINRLLCAKCGAYHTHLISGDEMILASVELNVDTNETTQNAV